MSQYQHINPTHGQKNTTDPSTKTDFKREFSGAVLKDSLAAESLQSGGSFSKGNPTGILDATAASTTLNRGDDTEGFRIVHMPEGTSGFGFDSGKDDGYKSSTTAASQSSDGGFESNTAMKSQKDESFGGASIVDKQPEVGSDEDPGRFAEARFVQGNTARDGAARGFGMGGMGMRDDNMFNPLDGDRRI
ncbi:hypothetical protein H072_1175 [Dactylellina haptotyla CBS 200.50]|uniref:Uncharacterized protein n=1 Tax=Dactylellina haptotyla (strain CBS 200.50) TaxID=1284197 RepID=S8CAZ7_DACHA|nr:hypothetical protein H072_1175 [Dactylellina haptotyla CBS 200.50]